MGRRPSDRDIAAYYDRAAGCCAPERLGWRRVGRTTRALKAAVIEAGVDGKTVLDLGCGTGELMRDLVRAGAERAAGYDLSSHAIERARGAAARDGLADRLTFAVGNGATARLDPHDVVVLDKVICCYHDWMGLAANAAGAARSTLAFSMPRTDGMWGLPMRIAVALENALHRLRGRGFRGYIHDTRALHDFVTSSGFRLRSRRMRDVWLVAVYERGSS